MKVDSAITPEEEMTERTESPPCIITIRMIMQGKEVGSIIGKKGDNVKRYREESGAKINISDASCAERVVTVTGSCEQIQKAFELICAKFEEDLATTPPTPGVPMTCPVSIRLVIPASQCGSLIGKGGQKIKDIREGTGASVQVASEMLPGSTERAVTISGPSNAITRCIYEICNIMLESPPKGATIPYRPKPAIQAPLMYAAAAGAAAQAAYGVPTSYMQALAAQQTSLTRQTSLSCTVASPSPTSSTEALVSQAPMVNTAATTLAPHYPHPQLAPQGTPLILPHQPQTAAYGSYMNPAFASLAMGAYMPRQNILAAASAPTPATQATEMVIPNELIGCIIGRGGAKINEIRQLSGAQIKISNCEEGTSDRKVTITGFPETISMATYLINSSIELHKSQLLTSDSLTTQASPLAMMPQATLAKPFSMFPYSAYGLGVSAAPSFTGLTAAYDQKALLTAANKLKVLPTAGVATKDARFTPY